MSTYTIDIRPRRQATLPRPFLKKLGADVGDALHVEVSGQKAIVKAKKRIALDAFREIQSAFSRSKISEATLQRSVDSKRTPTK